MKTTGVLAATVSVLAIAMIVWGQADRATTRQDRLIDGFKKTTVASVADAVDQVVGERGYMDHSMRPVIEGPVVGRAVTTLVRPSTPQESTPPRAVQHAVEMIEEANPGEVGVIVIEDGLDVAGIGGLMATTAQVRGMAGMVIDGGVRDVTEIRAMGLPVYGRSVTPATAVGRYASVAKQIPVTCGGVVVRPGDIIVAGEDGVVRVPQEKADEQKLVRFVNSTMTSKPRVHQYHDGQ